MLNKLQQLFLQYFSRTRMAKSFYWTGGTALAECYLHHRISYDLDFFTDKALHYNRLIHLINRFAQEQDIKTVKRERLFDRRLFAMKKGRMELKVEFVQYEFSILEKFQKNPKYGLYVAGLKDITASKVMAIFDRNEPKDVVDLYYLMAEQGYTIDQILQWVKEKFKMELEKLVLFQEITRSMSAIDQVSPLLTLPAKEQQHKIKEIKKFFERLSNEHLSTKISI